MSSLPPVPADLPDAPLTVDSPGDVPAVDPGFVRVAAIDCGTNSIRLLIADVDAERNQLRDHVRLMEVVRLGQGVDKTEVGSSGAGAHVGCNPPVCAVVSALWCAAHSFCGDVSHS